MTSSFVSKLSERAINVLAKPTRLHTSLINGVRTRFFKSDKTANQRDSEHVTGEQKSSTTDAGEEENDAEHEGWGSGVEFFLASLGYVGSPFSNQINF
jgi:hypothetical protein